MAKTEPAEPETPVLLHVWPSPDLHPTTYLPGIGAAGADLPADEANDLVARGLAVTTQPKESTAEVTAPGTQVFTYLQLGKESVAGTSVAATRMFYPSGTGMFSVDPMLTLHEGANRGTRFNLTHGTQQGLKVLIPFATDPSVGVAWDELPFYFCNFKGGVTGTGGSADKTWTFAPSMTAANSQESFTIEAGDDIQEYEFEYCQATAIHLSAGIDALTQGAIDWFGRQSTKSTKTASVSNNAVKIPGDLWTVKFATTQSGLTGASISSNFLRAWSLDLTTGLLPRKYMDGTLYFGQSVESAFMAGTISLTVDSTSVAVSEFYDKMMANPPTVSFIRLKATGPVLGSSFYSAQIDVPVIYTAVQPIGSETDGVNEYAITGTVVYDCTFTNGLTATVVNSIAALTA